MQTTAIMALGENGEIGQGDKLPWHIPRELEIFRNETMGGLVVMGRKTWEGLPVKPLPGRVNVVLTTQDIPGVLTAKNYADILAHAYLNSVFRIYFIGGPTVYTRFLYLCNRAVITTIFETYPNADRFFEPKEHGLAVFRQCDELFIPKSQTNPAMSVIEYKRA